MAAGWVRIHRELMDDSDYFSEPFTRTQAWIDLILIANYAPGTIRKRGITVNLNRGDVGRSQEELAKRWRWSRGKIIRFLSELVTKQWVVLQGTNVTTCITIVDYDKYQTDGTADEQESVMQTGSKRYMNKKNKNNKEINTPAPVLKLVTEVDALFVAFNEWLGKHAPRVLKMKEPITLEQYHRLQQEFNTPVLKKLLTETLQGMHDYELLFKRRSANLTVRDWMRRSVEKNPSLYETKSDNGLIQQQTAREEQAQAILNGIR